MRIAFIGLGEAASAIISGWGTDRAASIRAYDVKSDAAGTAQEISDRAEALRIEACSSRESAVADADVVFSTVTADQAVAAAEENARFLAPGTWWCDLNSCAPQSKRRAARVIEAAGGRYVDVAVMAPVYPKRNMVPCLISGTAAAEARDLLAALPMSLKVVGSEVGRASSIKLVRSIMVKGLEALTAECALAAAAAGVAEDVFPSMKDGPPRIDVPERAAYNFERMVTHGTRRAAEMEECAVMLSDLGLPNAMSLGTADWERRVSEAGIALVSGQAPDWDWFAEALLPRLLYKD